MFSILSFFMVLVITLQSIFASVLFPRSMTPIAHAQVAPQAVLSGNFTSPSVLGNSMWVSGSTDVTGAMPSSIYKSVFESETGTWLTPRPEFSVPGFKVSDPSILQNGTNLLMYYTKLSADVVGTSTALQNTIGLAVLDTQGSLIWNDVGTVIPQANGIDSRSGWAPSAVFGGGGIWVYFTTNGPGTVEVYRARFDSTGERLLGTDRIYFGDGTANPLSLFNIDVAFQNEQYIMLANSSLTSVVRYISADGVHWYPPVNQANPILTSNPPSIIGGPTVAQNANGSATIFFAGGTLANGWDSVNRLDQLDLSTPAAFASQNAANQTTNTASSSDSNIAALLAVGLIGIAAIVAYALFGGAATVAAPAATAAPVASNATGISFGGRVLAIQVCNTGLLVQLHSAVAPFPVIPIMWLTGELPYLSFIPPHPGQLLLGKIAPVVVPCVLGTAPIGAGFPIIFHGSSI